MSENGSGSFLLKINPIPSILGQNSTWIGSFMHL